jgi:hypothetical protein
MHGRRGDGLRTRNYGGFHQDIGMNAAAVVFCHPDQVNDTGNLKWGETAQNRS